MDDSPLLALEHLRRTSGKRLAKAAVAELLRLDVVRATTWVPPGRRRSQPRPALTDGSASLPAGALLLLVARTVRTSPAVVAHGRRAHDLRVVAQGLAGLRHGLADAALADLAAAGLVERAPRRLLGLVEVRTWRRTPAGDRELARRRTRVDSGGDAAVTAGPTGDDRDRDTTFDDGFDASFDSGFSDGGGDGGGGDGGGGGD